MPEVTREPLDGPTVLALADILRAAHNERRVMRDMIDVVGIGGTARSVGDRDGMFMRPDEDIRDCFLRVSLDGGMETFWPLSELVEEYGNHLFVIAREH